MLIRLDKITSQDFVSRWITDVNVEIINAGCAGSKIAVTPRTNEDQKIPSEVHLGITSWVESDLAEKMDGAQIARAKGKYYLVSKKIAARCGCGTSFSFEKKVISTDLAKIHRLKNALQASPESKRLQELIASKKKS